ncbi:hypothetical protein DNTS_006104 [Danionella cerebrum]|uniref:Chemokine interleukin-8-like domain-containing protein n=1 Tax=Danionella cerebrum TaxID=2873325 RepID=A0A553QMG6_9TELE|nr:hypothetical protein DNTS_006104 [Danionella translucida]
MRSASIALLCLTSLMLVHLSSQIASKALCPCLKNTDRVPPKIRIKSYARQPGACHTDAVLFITDRGKTFCSNPKQARVKEAIAFLNKKTAAIKQPSLQIHHLIFKQLFNISLDLNTTSPWNTTR